MATTSSPAPPQNSKRQCIRPKLVSCTSCQHRKVKCDKAQPICSNCSKHGANCVYLQPAPPRRKKRKSPEEQPKVYSKRHEALLATRGIPANDDLYRDSTETGNNSGLDASQLHVLIEQVPKNKNSIAYDASRPYEHSSTDAGKQGFNESPLWNVLSEELQGPVDMLRLSQSNGNDCHQFSSGAPSEDLLNAGDFLLSNAAIHSAVELKNLHPKPLMIFQLWQVFLDNVNPLTKLIHAPTTQQRLLDAIANLESISNESEALMFAIYLSAVQSMSTGECQSILGEGKGALIRKYHPAVRSALLRANFASSLNILVVQAFALYLLSVRQYHEPNSLWILTGTAVRLGQRIGLHRDGLLIGLSPFETEIRRRVWWRLLALDGQTAELCGAGFSVAFPRYDTKKPLNVNDSELSVNMSALPLEHDGPTEMIFCGFRYEIGLFLRNVKATTGWMGTRPTDTTDEERKTQLDDLSALIERKYLRFCDPSVPLHLFARLMGEATIMALKLVAPFPRRYPQGLIDMPQKERDEVFLISMHILKYYNLSQRMQNIRQFLWNVNVHFQWHAFIILAHELELRPEDQHARDAWSQIEELFEYNADVIFNINTPLHKAVSRLVLKAWSARHTRLRQSKSQLPVPVFVATLQSQAASQDGDHYSMSYAPPEPTATEYPSASRTITAEPTSETNGLLETLMPDVLVDGTPIDWSEWDDMLQDFELQNASFAQT